MSEDLNAFDKQMLKLIGMKLHAKGVSGNGYVGYSKMISEWIFGSEYRDSVNVDGKLLRPGFVYQFKTPWSLQEGSTRYPYGLQDEYLVIWRCFEIDDQDFSGFPFIYALICENILYDTGHLVIRSFFPLSLREYWRDLETCLEPMGSVPIHKMKAVLVR